MKLKPKLALWLLPLLLAQALVLIITSYLLYQDDVKGQIQLQVRDSLLQVKSTLQTELQKIEADSAVLAGNVVLNRYLMTNENIRGYMMYGALATVFESFLSVHPEYREISLLMPDGYEEVALLTDDTLNRTDNEQDTAYFRAIQASNTDFRARIMLDPDSHRWMLVALRKLQQYNPSERTKLSQSQLKGYLVIKSDLNFFNLVIDNSSLFNEGFSLLYQDDSIRVLEQGSTRLSAEGLARLAAQKQESDTDRISYQENLMLDARSYLVGQLSLMDDLYFAIAWPVSGLRQLLWEVASSSIRNTAIILLFSLLLLFWLMNRILISPILQLGIAARQLGEGDEHWHFHSRSNDELSGLANTVREMGQTLLEQKRELYDIAYLDSLTRLPNRRRLLEELEHHYAHSDGGPPSIALLFLDLDEFKHINDTMGHETGDAMLLAVAQRLAQSLRGADVVRSPDPVKKADPIQLARLGGDEFTILLRNIRSRSEAEAVARRILDALAAPLTVNEQELRIGVSIGIALAAEVGESVSELLKSADLAMYDAKREGKNTYRFFCRSSALISLKNLEIKDALHRAIDHDELQLAYQPQICARSGRLLGCEALLRWHHPDKGWITPDVFIPIAEQYGLILPLGRWVILEACHQIKAWQSCGHAVPRVSVNVSFIQLLREDMHQLLQDCLGQLDLAPDCLTVEVTESCIMQGEEAISRLREIQKAGIRIALDDFGTGYSSLSALKGLPIDELKIDRSFITDLNQGTDGKAIVSAVIAMAQQLNLEVVAEGVENETELAYLRQRGADIIQGYYFSKPLLKDEFTDYLSRHSASLLRVASG